MSKTRIPRKYASLKEVCDKMVLALETGGGMDPKQKVLHDMLAPLVVDWTQKHQKHQDLKTATSASELDSNSAERKVVEAVRQVVLYLDSEFQHGQAAIADYGVAPKKHTGGRRKSKAPHTAKPETAPKATEPPPAGSTTAR